MTTLAAGNAYGPFISFASFFMTWHTQQINPAPMFLKIRDAAGSRVGGVIR
jgi:hypothetical protein